MLSPPESTAEPVVLLRTALLVFARSLRTELEAHHWPRRFAPLLKASKFSRGAGADLDTHFFTDDAPEGDDASANVHAQTGRDFGERLRNAVQRLAGKGYQHLIVVGGDCPELAAGDIARAAALLDHSDAVLGPDHRGGTYLIGFHTRDSRLLDSVVWQRHTDFRQLQTLFAGRAVALLPVKIDLDRWCDLALYARREGALQSWLARELAQLAVTLRRTVKGWVDLARQSDQARRLTSPPSLVAP